MWQLQVDDDVRDADLKISLAGDMYFHKIEISSIGAFCYDESEINLGFNWIKTDVQIMNGLLSHQHLVMATSKSALTAEKANKACQKAHLAYQFQEVSLEGNLRSSPQISNLTSKYQSINPSPSANIPVKTSLEFFASKPSVTLVESNDRAQFVKSVLEKAREAALESSDVEITVLHLCHLCFMIRRSSRHARLCA